MTADNTFRKQRNSCVDSQLKATLGSGLGPSELGVNLRCGTTDRPSLRQGFPSATAHAQAVEYFLRLA